MKINILIKNIDNLLPQTQCTKCGFQDCYSYAEAIATSNADYNRCPPGGQSGVDKIAKLLGLQSKPIDESRGQDHSLTIARINESACIGCTLCIQACPIDAIIGTAKHMHSILEKWCTGCGLCISPCPVDCIELIPSQLKKQIRSSQKTSDILRERYKRSITRKLTKERIKNDFKNTQNIQKESDKENKKMMLLMEAMSRAKRLR